MVLGIAGTNTIDLVVYIDFLNASDFSVGIESDLVLVWGLKITWFYC